MENNQEENIVHDMNFAGEELEAIIQKDIEEHGCAFTHYSKIPPIELRKESYDPDVIYDAAGDHTVVTFGLKELLGFEMAFCVGPAVGEIPVDGKTLRERSLCIEDMVCGLVKENKFPRDGLDGKRFLTQDARLYIAAAKLDPEKASEFYEQMEDYWEKHGGIPSLIVCIPMVDEGKLLFQSVINRTVH